MLSPQMQAAQVLSHSRMCKHSATVAASSCYRFAGKDLQHGCATTGFSSTGFSSVEQALYGKERGMEGAVILKSGANTTYCSRTEICPQTFLTEITM